MGQDRFREAGRQGLRGPGEYRKGTSRHSLFIRGSLVQIQQGGLQVKTG